MAYSEKSSRGGVDAQIPVTASVDALGCGNVSRLDPLSFWAVFSGCCSGCLFVAVALGRFWVGVCRSWSCPLYRSVSVGSNSKKKRAPTPKPAVIRRSLFDRHPFLFRCSGSSVPCIRSQESAVHMVVYFVTAQIVGDRRFPGATILGGGSLHLPPTIPYQSRRLVPNLVMDSLSRLFWDFVLFYQRRCGVVSDALSRQPSSSSTSLRRLRLGVAAQASGTSLSDVSAIPDVAASRISRRRATATSTLLTCRGAAATSTPLTRRGAAAISMPL